MPSQDPSQSSSLWHRLIQAGVSPLLMGQQGWTPAVPATEIDSASWIACLVRFIQEAIPGCKFCHGYVPMGPLRLFTSTIPWSHLQEAMILQDFKSVKIFAERLIDNEYCGRDTIHFDFRAQALMNSTTYSWMRFNRNPHDIGKDSHLASGVNNVMHDEELPAVSLDDQIPTGTVVAVGRIPGSARGRFKRQQSYQENPDNKTVLLDWPSIVVMKVG